MASIPCPHCEQKTFNWWDKYLSGKWAILSCRGCRGRVCAQPAVMAIMYFFYLWDIVLFGYLAYLDSLWYLAAGFGGWLILDYFSLFIPLSALRPAGSKPDTDRSDATNTDT